MTIATIYEKTNAEIFRTIAAFFPKYLISRGTVTIPTIINVEMKTAICMIPAPLLSKAEASGKATKPGIKVIEPMTEAIIIPSHPDFCPTSFDIVSGLKAASRIPTRTRMAKN